MLLQIRSTFQQSVAARRYVTDTEFESFTHVSGKVHIQALCTVRKHRIRAVLFELKCFDS